jgi:hypothetical protein
MIIVRDSFFRKTISIVLLSFIVIINQSRAWIVRLMMTQIFMFILHKYLYICNIQMRITIHDYIDISNKTIKEKYNYIHVKALINY